MTQSSIARVWNRLFGRSTATSEAGVAERAQDEAAKAKQQQDRQRLQDEMSLREARNTIGFF